MSSNLHSIRPNPTSPTGQGGLAVVTRATLGEAEEVRLEFGPGEHYRVIAHDANVSKLAIDDRVLVQLVEGGAVVTHRLRAPGESVPAQLTRNEEGVTRLDAPEGLVLDTGTCRLELKADGRILIDGHEVRTHAEGLHCLTGARIELN